MRHLRLAALFLAGIAPLSVSADITLYACTINGQTILENTNDQKCDSLKTYNYSSSSTPKNKKNNNSPQNISQSNGLRPEEIRQLDAYDRASQMFNNVRDDYSQDQCAYYTQLYNQSLIPLSRSALGEIRGYELANQLDYAKSQIKYYCNNYYQLTEPTQFSQLPKSDGYIYQHNPH